MFLGLAGIAFVALLLVPVLGIHPRGLNTTAALSVDGASFLLGALLLLPIRYGRRFWPFVHFGLLAATASITAEAALTGELSPFAALGYVVAGTVAFVFLERRIAALHCSMMGLGYGVVVTTISGHTNPVGGWLLVMGALVLTGGTVAWLVDRTRALAETERRAREEAETARGALAEMNRTLEARVAAQVEDLQRLGRLRRFLSAPVAETVLSSGDLSELAPHRREVAVFFCDLRGFTAFAGTAQPEDVHAVLNEYFECLGELVRRYEATVGAFTGDGLMAFFNDPLPCSQPAFRAIEMALEAQSSIIELTERWREQGFDLGFGVGISFGYANLGMIGFEGRMDYSALGPVVNLAARLCGEALSGEILVDQRAYAATKNAIEASGPQTLHLKGFHDPVRAYRVEQLEVATTDGSGCEVDA